MVKVYWAPWFHRDRHDVVCCPCCSSCVDDYLEGSWVVISGVISRVTIVITHIRGFITLRRPTHEPPSTKKRS